MRCNRSRLDEGLASRPLIEALLEAGTEATEVLALPKTEDDRRLLASILMSEEEELTPETVEGAARALRGFTSGGGSRKSSLGCSVRGSR